MNPQLLTTFLTGVTETLRDKISQVLLIPLTSAAVILVFIHGSTHEWDWYTEMWDRGGAVERTMLVAAIAFGFLLLAAALDPLTPGLSKLFEGTIWPTREIGADHFRSQWRERMERKDDWESLYKDFSKWYPRRPTPEIAEQTLLGPDPSWEAGMRKVSILLPDTVVPEVLAPGHIVNLHTRTSATPLVPGGILVTAVSPTVADEVIDGAAIALRDITIAVPPDEIQRIVSIPARRLLISKRSAIAETPFCDPAEDWARRWIAVPHCGGIPSAGDRVAFGYGGEELLEATFCELAGDRWIVAFKVGDLQSGMVPDWLRSSGSLIAVSYRLFNVPTVVSDVPEWSVLPGTVYRLAPILEGKVRVGEALYVRDEIVLEPSELQLRYTTREITAGSPVTRRALNSPGKGEPLQFVDWPFPDVSPPPEGRFCHFLLEDRTVEDSTVTSVIFNCRKIKGRVAIPENINVGKLTRLLYANGGALPNAPSDLDGRAPWRWAPVRLETITVSQPMKQDQYTTIVFPSSSASRATSSNSSGSVIIEQNPFTTTAVAPPFSSEFNPAPLAWPAIVEGASGTTTVTVLVEGTASEGSYPDILIIEKNYILTRTKLILELPLCSGPDKSLAKARALLETIAVVHAHLTLDAAFEPARIFLTEIRTGQRNVRDTIQYWVDRSRENFNLYFPDNPNMVVGTRFGNIIQTIASYGHEVYGMHTPVMLSRILKKLDADQRTRLDAARERISLLQWSFVSALVVAIVGPWMMISASWDIWWRPLALYLIAGWLVPWACIKGLESTALQYAEEARFLMDTQRGRLFDALGIDRPVAKHGQELWQAERDRWHMTGQWLEYGTENANIDVPPYTLPPADSDDKRESS